MGLPEGSHTRAAATSTSMARTIISTRCECVQRPLVLVLTFTEINLVAGGTGLTPHWQLIHAVLSDPSDKTCISLLDRYSFTWYTAGALFL